MRIPEKSTTVAGPHAAPDPTAAKPAGMSSSSSPASSTTFPSRHSREVRYWGFYANAARGKRRKDATTQASQTPRSQDDDEFTQRARLSWAKLIRRVYEVDPLLCPFCGSERKILAFIVDFGAAKATAKSLELPAQEPEPLAHAP